MTATPGGPKPEDLPPPEAPGTPADGDGDAQAVALPEEGDADGDDGEDDVGGDEGLAAVAAEARAEYRPPRAVAAPDRTASVTLHVLWTAVLLLLGLGTFWVGDYCFGTPYLVGGVVNSVALATRRHPTPVVVVNAVVGALFFFQVVLHLIARIA